MLLRGGLAHTPTIGSLEILEDYLVGNGEWNSHKLFKGVDDNGVINYLAPAKAFDSVRLLGNSDAQLIELPRGSFLLPTFCDLHLHAPQFLYQGTGLDLPLMQWLDTYTLKSEARMDEDPLLARRVYAHLASQLKENGTGTVLLFGTIKGETNLILAECMQSAGLRGFVGKLSMDIDITSAESRTTTYVEPTASASLAAAESFAQRCNALVEHLPKSQRLIEPVLTPRFVPTCTQELLTGLGDLSKRKNMKIQSHLAEAKDQVEWVRAERGMEDIDVFDQNNLLTPRTVQAHCTFLTAPDFERLFAKGTSIAHCPLSNAYFSAKPFPLREALDRNVKVGLGTDIAGGYSLDIMTAMRQAVAISRMREGERVMQSSADETEGRNLSIDWKESLFLATRGGSVSLGLEGIFKVGAPFDAQEIRIYDPTTRTGVRPLSYFDLEASSDVDTGLAQVSLTSEMIEKWWCVGDTRNRGRLWVQGTQVKDL